MASERIETLGGLLLKERRAIDHLTGMRDIVERDFNKVSDEIVELKDLGELLEQAAAVLLHYAEQRQEDIQHRIEALLTEGLRTVFEEDLTFHILNTQQGRLASTEFVVRSRMGDEIVETNIMDARGGGVAVVAGFLLRLIILLLQPHKVDPFIVLDESFAQLSEDYEPALSTFIRELVDRTNVQLVLVTHSHAYTDDADSVYRFSLVDGHTKVEKVK